MTPLDLTYLLNEVLIILAVLAGYYLGRGRSPKRDSLATLRTISDALQPMVERSIPVGPVKRPTAAALASLHEPEPVKQTKDAIRETLDQVPELAEAKAKVAQMKAEGSWIP